MRAALMLLGCAQAQSGLLNDLKNLAFPGAAVNTDMIRDEPTKAVNIAADGSTQEEEIDLLCLSGPQAQTWFNIQQKMRYILPPESAFGMVGKDILEPALYSIVEDMASISVPNQDTCGVGKLLIQTLSILSNDENGSQLGQHIKNNEQLTSPMLTLLLDIPWNVYQPMWPMFGFFAQIAMRRVQVNTNDSIIDGLMQPELQHFAQALDIGIVNGDLESLQHLASAYLETGADGVRESPLAFMTALFTRAATTDNREEAQELFNIAQGVMKRMVHNPMDLDTCFSTRWPLWGMAYLAALKTAV